MALKLNTVKLNTLPRQGSILVPLSVILALGFSSTVIAQPMSGVTVAKGTAVSEPPAPEISSSEEIAPPQRRVKSCAAPCRHKPSSMR